MGGSVLCRNMTLFASVLTHELQIQHQNRSPVGYIHRNFDRSSYAGAVQLVGECKRTNPRRVFGTGSTESPFEDVGTDGAAGT